MPTLVEIWDYKLIWHRNRTCEARAGSLREPVVGEGPRVSRFKDDHCVEQGLLRLVECDVTWTNAVLLRRLRMASTLALYRQCCCIYVLFRVEGRKSEGKNFFICPPKSCL